MQRCIAGKNMANIFSSLPVTLGEYTIRAPPADTSTVIVTSLDASARQHISNKIVFEEQQATPNN